MVYDWPTASVDAPPHAGWVQNLGDMQMRRPKRGPDRVIFPGTASATIGRERKRRKGKIILKKEKEKEKKKDEEAKRKGERRKGKENVE